MIEIESALIFGSMSTVLFVATVYLFWVNKDALFGKTQMKDKVLERRNRL